MRRYQIDAHTKSSYGAFNLDTEIRGKGYSGPALIPIQCSFCPKMLWKEQRVDGDSRFAIDPPSIHTTQTPRLIVEGWFSSIAITSGFAL